MKPPTICLLGKKGGIGRTTLALSLAGAAARDGKKALVIDMESQASVTQFFLGSEATERLPLDVTVSALFSEEACPDPKRLIHDTHIEGIALLPANELLGNYELPKPHETGSLQFALRDFLDDVKDRFDFILIDTPPAIGGLLAWSSLLASDYVLTPMVAEMFSSQSLIGVQRTVERAIVASSSPLRLLGYVINQRDKRKLENVTEKTVRELYGDQVFKTVIPRLQGFRDSIPMQQPVSHLPKSQASKVIDSLLKEIFTRIKRTSTTSKTRRKKAS